MRSRAQRTKASKLSFKIGNASYAIPRGQQSEKKKKKKGITRKISCLYDDAIKRKCLVKYSIRGAKKKKKN